MTPETDLHPPILYSDEWTTPILLSSAVNTAGGEDSPFILPDGNTLYFFFTPNVTVPAEKQVLDKVTGIYVSRKVNGSWTTAERVVLQNAGKLALDGAEFVQGDVMWFASAREGYTGVNLFTAEFKNGKWTNWQYVGDKLMKDYQVGEMHITADGTELYYHSARAGGKGQLDIWVTRKIGGEWQTPENVAAVNTPENDGWPFVSQDGNELWFTRTYYGTPAVFRSTKVNGTWATPELIVSQFAGEPTLDNAGNLYFVHHYYSNETKMIEADIYVAYRK
jgi:Tol biopolymer transport system component